MACEFRHKGRAGTPGTATGQMYTPSELPVQAGATVASVVDDNDEVLHDELQPEHCETTQVCWHKLVFKSAAIESIRIE
jgi:uncharacterized cupredoxin-like copper-binding protein